MIIKDGKVLFPDVLYPIAGNFFLAFFTGERLSRKDHRMIQEVAKAAVMFQRNSDPTGGAILFFLCWRYFTNGASLPALPDPSKKITDFIRVSIIQSTSESL